MALACMISRLSVVRPRLGPVFRTRLFGSTTMNTEVKDADERTGWVSYHQLEVLLGVRSKVKSYIKDFLVQRGFTDVSRSYDSQRNEAHMQFYLRSASEFYLKPILARDHGRGLERIYEMSKECRSERIDSIITGDFTTCDMCMSFGSYYDLMKLMEDMISGAIKEFTGGYKIKIRTIESDFELDFTPPFKRVDMLDELERIANLSIPKDLNSREAHDYMLDACTKFGFICPLPHTTARLLDTLVAHFLEEAFIQPTFIMNHPEIMCHFAKWHVSKPGLTERFQLLVSKMELCNGCSDLNDAAVLRENFAGIPMCEADALALEDYLTALDYGFPGGSQVFGLRRTVGLGGTQVYRLPPTAGCQVFIEPLSVLLIDSRNIKEVLVSPAVKPQDEP